MVNTASRQPTRQITSWLLTQDGITFITVVCLSAIAHTQNKPTTFGRLTLRLLMSYIYIYIYDISSLRVNDLTLILLTWRKF